jgi:hypothetical protein
LFYIVFLRLSARDFKAGTALALRITDRLKMREGRQPGSFETVNAFTAMGEGLWQHFPATLCVINQMTSRTI